MLSSQGPKGTGAAAPGFAEKAQGWRQLRVCFAASLKQPELCWALGSWRCQGHPAAHIHRAQAGTATPCPPAAATSLPPAPLGLRAEQGQPQGCGFTLREVKVWGRQEKQNKSLVPGTCSLPLQKCQRQRLREEPLPLRSGVVFHCPFILG